MGPSGGTIFTVEEHKRSTFSIKYTFLNKTSVFWKCPGLMDPGFQKLNDITDVKTESCVNQNLLHVLISAIMYIQI